MTPIYSYYLYFGTISKAALLADPANNIESFPMQADQPYPGLAWTEPERELTKRPTPARVTMNADLSQDADGFFEFQWGWRYYTEGQMAYILQTGFGDVNRYDTMSIPVTVQTYFDSGYVAFHAYLLRPVWGVQYTTEDGGYGNVVLRYTRGVIIS